MMSRSKAVRSAEDWTRLLAGLMVTFAIFQWAATALGSDRGQAGTIVAALVVAATMLAERLWFAPTLPAAARALGLGAPHRAGLLASVVIGVLLVSVVPLYSGITGAGASLEAGSLRLLPGLFAQAGVAEEILFRGYLFGHLRRGRSFARAATLSMVPFVAVHLLMFATMPWPIALAALLLAVAISFPMAHLFELGGATIWPPALLHFVVQGTVKIVRIDGDPSSAFPLVWMAASVAMPMLALLLPRPPATGCEP
jgi:membrane protease YdiL (CAAX protease family)